jgi:hypothetical protein
MLAARRLALMAAVFGAAALAIPALAQTNDPSFRLTNNSAATINELYVSSSAMTDWGPDRLGQNVLGSGQSYVVRLPAGQCMNDVRVVYANGQANERRQINTCALTDMVFP